MKGSLSADTFSANGSIRTKSDIVGSTVFANYATIEDVRVSKYLEVAESANLSNVNVRKTLQVKGDTTVDKILANNVSVSDTINTDKICSKDNKTCLRFNVGGQMSLVLNDRYL